MARKDGDLPTLTLDDLQPSPANPRKIGADALKGLGVSLTEFGDISGIVWNKRTRTLVAGHQRLVALRERWGDQLKLVVDGDRHALTCPAGQFSIRVVDWDEGFAHAAMLAANNEAIAGAWTDEVDALRAQIEAARPDLADSLLLFAIEQAAEEVVIYDGDEHEGGEVTGGPPDMELQPFEHYDYVLVLADNVQDWEWLVDRLGLERVNASPIAAKKKIGLGRAIRAGRLIALMRKEGAA